MDVQELVWRIGYFRNKARLSARELSLQIGKSPNYINKIESRGFMVTLPVLFDIFEALGISCAEFFADDYANYRQNKEVFDLLEGLPKERKKSFIDLIKNIK